MGKPRKSRKNNFNYNKDRRKAWKKSKKLPSIPCEPIKKAWDESRSAAQNLRDMGLSADPNKTLSMKPTKERAMNPATELHMKQAQLKASKSHVAEELEAEANQPVESTMRLSDPVVQYCVYMINKYGEDYKAMARDPKNYYQDTPKQIRRKILTFKNTPTQYKAYLSSLEECWTPTTSSQEKVKAVIVPRRRMSTRGFEAASRNGHFRSLSPLPATLAASKKADESLLAAMVRVRRRLRFGRKPPRERRCVREPGAPQEIRSVTPMRDTESVALKLVWTPGDISSPADDDTPANGTPLHDTQNPEEPSTCWSSLPLRSRRKLVMVELMSGTKPGSRQSQRET